MGAPRGNINAIRTLARSDPQVMAMRFELGTMPRGWERCERVANHFRRVIEAAVMQAHGEITVVQALAINTAARLERHCQVALKLLRDGRDLATDQRCNLSREIARASAERDKAIDRLKLDRTAKDSMQDALDAYYTSAPEPVDSTDQPGTADAPGATPESQAGQ
jgi:hypothetical protein